LVDGSKVKTYSLVQQLEYDKFTPAQAAHGARSVGL
jgi:hypothetical protein